MIKTIGHLKNISYTVLLLNNCKEMSRISYFSFAKLLKMAPNLEITNRLNSTTAIKLVYSEYGDPVKVIHREEEKIGSLESNDVLVKMIASPVNPADINTIQGKYPVKTTLPAVPGNEGVGKVLQLGTGVTDLQIGDHVVPLLNALGTWRTHLVLTKDNVLKIPKELGVVEAATLTVNPCTAYRMLRDFENLKPGDTIIQNGGNSACGQNVIQIARSWGLKTVNIVRDRADLNVLRTSLQQLGATYVLTEEELRTTNIFKNKEVEKPKLALNCVGGQSALELLRHLQNGGTMVTYGGMSRQPVTVPTSALIFKDLKVRGFWLTRWSADNADNIDRFEMFEELISMMTNNDLRGPAFKIIPFEQYKEALMNTMTIKGMDGKKYILGFE